METVNNNAKKAPTLSESTGKAGVWTIIEIIASVSFCNACLQRSGSFFRPGSFQQCLDLRAFLIQDAAAVVVVQQEIPASKRCEQRGVHRLTQRAVFDVHIRIRREGTRLRAAMGVDVETSRNPPDLFSGGFDRVSVPVQLGYRPISTSSQWSSRSCRSFS